MKTRILLNFFTKYLKVILQNPNTPIHPILPFAVDLAPVLKRDAVKEGMDSIQG